FDKVADADRSRSVDAQVIKSMRTTLAPESLRFLNRTIKSLPKNQKALGVFNEKSKGRSTTATFRVGVCSPDSNGFPRVQIGYFHYDADSDVSNALFMKFTSRRVSFSQARGTMVLNQDAYAKVRDDVNSRIGPRALELIESVDVFRQSVRFKDPPTTAKMSYA
ncbi:hypothetical protein L218DRAFT_952022, partial [Marasmius fiardii PR-910]